MTFAQIAVSWKSLQSRTRFLESHDLNDAACYTATYIYVYNYIGGGYHVTWSRDARSARGQEAERGLVEELRT